MELPIGARVKYLPTLGFAFERIGLGTIVAIETGDDPGYGVKWDNDPSQQVYSYEPGELATTA